MSDEIAFPAVAAPDVSVVMVLHNAWEWSQRALCALVEATPGIEVHTNAVISLSSSRA